MTLQSRRLPWQQPLQAKSVERYVYSYEEMLTALAQVRREADNRNRCWGKSIVVVGTVVVPQPIDLSDILFSGLRITSRSRAIFMPAPSCYGLPLFRITSTVVTSLQLDSFSVDPQDVGSGSFSTVLSAGSTILCSLKDIAWTCDALFTGTGLNRGSTIADCLKISGTGGISGQFQDSRICDNIGNGLMDIAFSSTSTRNLITNNIKLRDVTLAANGRWCVFSNNADVNLIDTSASTGNNTIVGNALVGTINPAGSDQVGLNT